jgi:hypothetical protein
MGAYHIVRQREHISALAFLFGFLDYRAIWNHPENAALKDERQNPNVLYPGDRVFIPDKNTCVADAATDRRHIYVLLHAEPLRFTNPDRKCVPRPRREYGLRTSRGR